MTKGQKDTGTQSAPAQPAAPDRWRYEQGWRPPRAPSRSLLRFRALVAMVVLLALLAGPVWYLGRAATPMRITGRFSARSLVLRVPGGAAPPELVIPAPRSVRLEGANIYGKGFKGAIVLDGEEMSLAPDVDFVLTAADVGTVNSIELATDGPLTVQLQTDQELEIQVEAGRVAGADQPGLPAVEYRFRASGRARGVVRAGRLTLQQAKEFSFADRLVNTVRLASEEQDTPLGFSAAAEGAEARLHLLLQNPGQDRIPQPMHAAAGSVAMTGTSGRLLVGGKQSILLTGLEEVEMRGQLEVNDIEVQRDHVGVSVTGTGRDVLVERGSVLPTMLDQLATRPLWTTGFVIVMVLWTGLVLPVMRLLLTGTWGDG